MIACSCRSLFRINLLAWKSSNTCAKSGSFPHIQKFNFCHGLSSELIMDVGKGKQAHFDRKKQKPVSQAWRPVSTQSNSHQHDVENMEAANLAENTHVGITLDVSTANSEIASIKAGNVQTGAHTCVTVKGSNDDKSLDDNLRPPEKHSMSMEIGGSLLRFIRGKGGETQEEIEVETKVKIIFPSSKKEDSIIIEGDSAESVSSASKKIQSIIEKAVNSREFDYSHFVSLPLAIHPGLVDKLVNFQNMILGIEESGKDETMQSNIGADTLDEEEKGQHSTKVSEVSVELKAENTDPHIKANITSDQNSTPDKVNITNISLVSYPPKHSKSASKFSSSKLSDLGIEKSIFIKPKTFHLTVLMLKLWKKDQVKEAAQVLQSVSSKVMDALENRPLSIRLKGLECMRGSLAKARVVYAPVEEIGGEGRLLRACQVIIDAFTEAGLVIDKDLHQKLKLHATIMNARHRKRQQGSRKDDSFDARGIFDRYGLEDWGEYPITEAHLSQRFVFDENGYYHCCASVPFPKSMEVE